MPCFGIFRLEFETTVVTYEISTFKFVYLQNFTKKQKEPNFGTKNPWFMYFSAGIWKQYCHIWNQHTRICLIAKFHEKRKICLTLGPKVPYLVIFGQGLWKYYCHISNQHPQCYLIATFAKKQKSLNLGPKMSYLGIFGLEI